MSMFPTLEKLQVAIEAVGENEIYCHYLDHAINVSRDADDEDWYIDVEAPDGTCPYDGWWQHSANKTAEQAALEALTGSMLINRQMLATLQPAKGGE
ncbi:hypothetical protein CFN79_19105 [Chromobacterium vaccinii]|uniref:hypothetical protein n=1 Tax=Chromobacterium vaccinii TaxID=1108595 RepID=UPI000CE9A4F0|nr:hypothetical protein [Chromobacterium vaccinii]AVG17807.1 hypothetical protein CFN79_19105 [Chromobacterium vaccinii]